MIKRFNQLHLNEASLNDIKDIKKLFHEDSGFDTPKKLNRSEEYVPKAILDKIEQGITLEDLESIDLPVFKYKTQITIHGQFSELTKQRIGGYKLIFQNKNKSIGVKWTAIDYEKKKRIYTELAKIKYYIKRTSSVYKAYKVLPFNEENLKQLKIEYDNIDESLFIGTKDIYVGSIPFLGKYVILDLNIKAIKESDINEFLEGSFAVDWDEVNKESEDRKLRQEEERRKRNEEQEKRYSEKIRNAEDELESKYKVIEFGDIPQECTMVFVNDYGDKIILKKYDRKGEDVYQQIGRFNEDELEKINKRLRKVEVPESRVKNHFEKRVVFLANDLTPVKKEKPQRKVKTFDEHTTGQGEIEVVFYSNKSLAIFGNTYSIKDKLKEIGARFNRNLVHPETKDKKPGWIISRRKEYELKQIINED